MHILGGGLGNRVFQTKLIKFLSFYAAISNTDALSVVSSARFEMYVDTDMTDELPIRMEGRSP